MSGPKHLWSGDWRDESAAASEQHAARRPKPRQPEPAAPAGSPPPSRPEPKPRPKRTGARPNARRALPIALAALVLVAGGALALTNLSGSPRHRSSGLAIRPSAPANRMPTSTATPPIYWLGMQIETVPPGAAEIATVRQGSPGDQAGLSPGDAIVEINNRPIAGTNDISAAIHGLHAGHPVVMQISHGSALFTTVVTLAAPPSSSP